MSLFSAGVSGIQFWPQVTAAMLLAGVFGLLGRAFGSGWSLRQRLLWMAAAAIGGAGLAVLPIGGLPVYIWISPLAATTSLFTLLMVLCCGMMRTGWPVPRSASLVIFVASVVIMSEITGWLPFSLYESGYVGAPSMAKAVLAAYLFLVVALIALFNPWIGILAILPGLLWTLGLANDPNLWASYLDLPLAIASLLHLLSVIGQRRVGLTLQTE